MRASTATLRARQCHGRGMVTSTAEIKAKMGSSGYCIAMMGEEGENKEYALGALVLSL